MPGWPLRAAIPRWRPARTRLPTATANAALEETALPRAVRLRPWQKSALDAFAACTGPDFLAVATPGAGKTTFALAAALGDLAARRAGRLLVVTPTQHLKSQWAAAAAPFGLHLQPSWSARDGRLPADMHGVVVTYQQVAADAAALRSLAADAFVVFDEVHHAGDERAWGDGVRHAFELAAKRLAVSGTPFRSDTVSIPFVRYVDGEAEADFNYGYGEALRDGRVVRPVFFPRVDGEMEWTAPDGSHRSHTFSDALDRASSGQRLRTALSLEGEWLPDVLGQAHSRLRALRATQPDAGGLVLAIDREHARGIARLLRERHGVGAVVVTSDDPGASAAIARFAASTAPWLVAVRMVSEGVDIPRLRVGVYATTTSTELFFRQAVGRLVRWTRGVRAQRAYLFLPDDRRLRTWAVQLAEQRRHSLTRREDDAEEAAAEALATGPTDEQLSLFAAISATARGTVDEHDGPDDATLDIEADETDETDDSDEADGLTLTLLDAPPPPGAGGQAWTVDDVPRAARKEQLRTRNAALARLLASKTARTHAQVNAELNRLAGIRSITEATVDQLERRATAAQRWLLRLNLAR